MSKAKFRLSSLFHSSPSPSPDAEAKKQNRRSFSALSSSRRHKDVDTNGVPALPPAPAPKVSEKESKSEAKPESRPEPPTSRMIALAQTITKATEKLEAHMKSQGLPMPDFDDVDSPADFPSLPPNVQQSRQEIIHATKELGRLAHGPRESVRWGIWEVSARRLDLGTVSQVDADGYALSTLIPWPLPPLTTTELVRRP